MRVVWTLLMILAVSRVPRRVKPRPPASSRQVILTPKPSPRPRINGAMIFGVRPGHPLLYTIAATGKRPMRFAAEGLPAGLTLDSQTGRLGGATTAQGEHVVTLRATNELGSAERKLRIVVGDRLALTPYMGWNQLVHLDGQRDRQDHSRRGRRNGRKRHDQPRLRLREHG